MQAPGRWRTKATWLPWLIALTGCGASALSEGERTATPGSNDGPAAAAGPAAAKQPLGAETGSDVDAAFKRDVGAYKACACADAGCDPAASERLAAGIYAEHERRLPRAEASAVDRMVRDAVDCERRSASLADLGELVLKYCGCSDRACRATYTSRVILQTAKANAIVDTPSRPLLDKHIQAFKRCEGQAPARLELDTNGGEDAASDQAGGGRVR